MTEALKQLYDNPETLRVLSNRILVRISPQSDKVGSFFIPQASVETSRIAEVVAVGPDVPCRDGSRQPIQIKVGYMVMLGRGGALAQIPGSDDLLLTTDERVMGVFVPERSL